MVILLKFSPSTGIQDEEEGCELGKQDLYQLNQLIQVGFKQHFNYPFIN